MRYFTDWLEVTLYCVITPCKVTRLLRLFGGARCFHLQGEWIRFRQLFKIKATRAPETSEQTYYPTRFNNT